MHSDRTTCVHMVDERKCCAKLPTCAMSVTAQTVLSVRECHAQLYCGSPVFCPSIPTRHIIYSKGCSNRPTVSDGHTLSVTHRRRHLRCPYQCFCARATGGIAGHNAKMLERRGCEL